MRARLKAEIKKHIIILSVGILYLVSILLFDVKIPCPINRVTGLLCPGCGITRMIVSIVKLDFVSAFHYNQLLFVTLPVICAVYVSGVVRYIKSGTRSLTKFSSTILVVEIIALIVFGIVRNIR